MVFSGKSAGRMSWTSRAVRCRGVPDGFGTTQLNTIMKTKIIATTLLLAVSLFGAEPAKTKPVSPEFERMKTLVGTWTGKTDMGQGPVDMTIRYRLIAGGS